MNQFKRCLLRFGALLPALLAVLLGGIVLTTLNRPAWATPTEENLPPPTSAYGSSATTTAPSPSIPLPAPASGNADGSALSTQPGATTPDAAETHAARNFLYTIRPGDTLATIAATFGMQVDDLTKANRISVDKVLNVGETLRIPNPFLAQAHALSTRIDQLEADRAENLHVAEQARDALARAESQLGEMAATNHEFEHDVRVLPWWRTTAYAASVGALLMFGVMLLALVEWWILRARFRAVAEMNETLRRLDYKYKSLMAKAELRLQELYGRRRQGLRDGHERAPIPEEIEIERLDLELKQILERHLEHLGPPNRRMRRARWHELMAGVGAPVEARSMRR